MRCRVAACLLIIAAGLALRHFGLGIGVPGVVVKYGGSMLWGAMVYFIVAILIGGRGRLPIALTAALIAVTVELFRLYHTPWLDGFRLTTAGALLLGRIFSVWNIVAYGVGIGFAAALDRLMGKMPVE